MWNTYRYIFYYINISLSRSFFFNQLYIYIYVYVGWAIEGAIGITLSLFLSRTHIHSLSLSLSYILSLSGTSFKIDASYLSAHCNMSNKLEEFTKEYKVPLLLSGDFVKVLSPDARDCCRMLDCVSIAGKRFDIWTFDMKVIPPSFAGIYIYISHTHIHNHTYTIFSLSLSLSLSFICRTSREC